MDRPVLVCHPSHFIREEMTARGWSLWDLASRTVEQDGDVAAEALSWQLYFAAHDPDLRMGAGGIAGVAKAFGTSQELFANLERAYIQATPEQREAGKCDEGCDHDDFI